MKCENVWTNNAVHYKKIIKCFSCLPLSLTQPKPSLINRLINDCLLDV